MINHRWKTVSYLEKRLERVRQMQRADKQRSAPNPLGDGYLTRNERYNEVCWEIDRRVTKERYLIAEGR